MKITNLTTEVLEFNDLGSYIKGVSPIIRDIKLQSGASKYLLETSEVLLSAQAGDIYRYATATAPKISVNDSVAIGATLIAVHNFNMIPNVTASKVVGGAWVPAVPVTDYTVSTNSALTTTTVVNISGVALKVRIS